MAQRLNIYSDGCESLRPNTRQHCDVVVIAVVSQKQGPDFDCTIWPGPVYVSLLWEEAPRESSHKDVQLLVNW